MLLRKRKQIMAAMNPAIIGIVNYRRRPRGPNIARASCQSAENCEKYMRLGQQEITELTRTKPLDNAYGGFSMRLNFCFALFTLLWSETKVSDSDQMFGLRL